MVQRIFDIKNKQDMWDLWNIFPHNINRIIRYSDKIYTFFEDEIFVFECTWLRINWHDKTEITRPIQEATEADIGKICVFWNEDNVESYGILTNTRYVTNNTIVAYIKNGYDKFEHCRRLTKQEIEELC